MRRQLDPNIFGSNQRPLQGGDSDTVGMFGSIESKEDNRFSTQDIAIRQVEELDRKVERIRSELDEWLKTANLRIERNMTRSTTVEQRLDDALKDIREKLAFLAGKVKERQAAEGKIESLLERHNQIISNFEIRLSQASRTIEEQNALIRKQQAALDENRHYIERIKRL